MNQQKVLVVQKDDFTKKVLLWLVFNLFALCISAQSASSDSQITPEQCEALLSSNPDSALLLIQIGMSQSTDTIQFAIIKGQALRRKGEALEAKLYFQSLLDAQMTNQQRAELNNNLGKVNANLAEYDQAIASFLSALHIMEESGDEQGQAFYLNNIGIVYDLQSVYDQALAYYTRSLELKIKLGMESSLPASYTNIGITMYHLGQLDSSLIYHKLALAGFEKQGKDNSIARSKNNIGFALIDLGNYDEAEEYLKSALQIRSLLNDQRGIAQTTNNLSVLYSHKNQLDKAWEAANKAEVIARDLALPEILKNAIQQKVTILARKGRYPQAYHLTIALDSLNQEIANTDKANKVAELEARYQNIKKEKEIQQQRLLLANKEIELKAEVSKRNFFLVISIILMLAGISMGYGYHQKSRAGRLFQAQNMLLQKESTRVQQSKMTLTRELDHIKMALEDRNQILQNVYEKPKEDLPPHLLQLSPREMEVLSYLALGWSDKEIAEKLYVSVSTTKTHLRRIYSKLLVKGRAEAVTIAHRHGIIGSV